MQVAQGCLLYKEMGCRGCEEAIEVLIDDEDNVPEAVKEDKSKSFSSSWLDRLKSH